MQLMRQPRCASRVFCGSESSRPLQIRSFTTGGARRRGGSGCGSSSGASVVVSAAAGRQQAAPLSLVPAAVQQQQQQQRQQQSQPEQQQQQLVAQQQQQQQQQACASSTSAAGEPRGQRDAAAGAAIAAAALLLRAALLHSVRGLGAWCRRHRLPELLFGSNTLGGGTLGGGGGASSGSTAPLVAAAAAAVLPALPGGGFTDLFTNRVFLAGFWGWFTAQALKIVTKRLKKGVWDIRAIVDSGGMPSSHSALCAGITTAIALQHGLGSSAFALAVAFSSIVMYDAAGVRRHAGKQAEVLNRVVGELLDGHPVGDVKLKEVLGHTPLQVAAGAVLGVLFGLFFPLPLAASAAAAGVGVV